MNKDTWPFRTYPWVAIGMLLLTLTYLFVEAAFNARLLDVLGRLDTAYLSAEAVTELELSGRRISSTAVALALFGVHLVQWRRGIPPFPFNIVHRLVAPQRGTSTWGAASFLLAAAVMVSSWIIVFHWQKWVVEELAQAAAPLARREAFYAARVSQAATLCALDMRRADGKSMLCKPQGAPALDIDVRSLALPFWDRPDGRAFSAVFPEVVLGYARTLGTEAGQFEADTLAWMEARLGAVPARDTYASFGRLLRCARLQYDSRSFRQPETPDALATDTDMSKESSDACLSEAQRLSILVPKVAARFKQEPDAIWKILKSCTEPKAGPRTEYLDFRVAQCLHGMAMAAVTPLADDAANEYAKGLRDGIRRVMLTTPENMPVRVKERIKAVINDQFDQSEMLKDLGVAQAMHLRPEDELPPCESGSAPDSSSRRPQSFEALLRPRAERAVRDRGYRIFGEEGLVAARRYEALARSLEPQVPGVFRTMQEQYCLRLLASIPAEPTENPAALRELLTDEEHAALVRDAREAYTAQIHRLEAELAKQELTLSEGFGALPEDWDIEPRAVFAARIAGMVQAELNLHIVTFLRFELPDAPELDSFPARMSAIAGFDDFLADPSVNGVLRGVLEGAVDNLVACAGLPELQRLIRLKQPLQVEYSSQWASDVHAPLLRGVSRHLFDNYLSGTTADFAHTSKGEGARCHTAGIMAHHRTFVPGFALFLSALGLVYHSFKALLYLLRVVPMPSASRTFVCVGVIGVLAMVPFTNPAPVLYLPAVKGILDGYERAEGPGERLRIEWMISSQRYLHGFTSEIYRYWHRLTGIGFMSPNPDLTTTPIQVTAQREAACSALSRHGGSAMTTALDNRLIFLIKTNNNLCAPRGALR